MNPIGVQSRTARRWLAALILAILSALAAVRWRQTFQWRTRERLRYYWALRARLAGRYAWGRPADSQLLPTAAELDADLARAARDVSAFERAVIGYRARRQA